MSCRLTWLHISDWHQGDVDYDRTHVGRKLTEDIERCMREKRDLSEIDFIVFSGDVAYAGSEAEYEQSVEHLFKPLMRATGMEPSLFWQRLLVVPGNHDIDRTVIDQSKDEELRDPLGRCANTSEKRVAVNRYLRDPGKRWLLTSPFNNFHNFIERKLWEGTGELIRREPSFYQLRRVEKDGLRVGIVGFNSALLSYRTALAGRGPDDYGQLVIGEPPIQEALDKIRGDDIRIAVMHHPLSWLADFDRDFAEEQFYKTCHFVLHGHQHLPRVHVIQSTIGDTVNIPAGTLYSRRFETNPRYTNSYNFAHLDLGERRGTVYLRRWDERRNSWVEDDAYRHNGRFPFLLPKTIEPSKREIYHTQASSLVGKIGERFCESYVVTVKSVVQEQGGTRVVRQEVTQRVRLCPGAPETFTAEVKVSGNNRVVSPNAQAAAPPQRGEVFYFRVNNQPQNTFTVEGNRISYAAQLDGNEAIIDYKYVLNMGPDDFFIILLKRFTKHFLLHLEKDEKLTYEFVKLGDIPAKHPSQQFRAPSDKAETFETTAGELCRPEQGMVIQWYCK
ncbi:MAG TPA: metallophosphoesterase [Pyrinomonadaceae bacterium]|nr:metallophosphoesterase [Pyrinomonadaceae bacterium]